MTIPTIQAEEGHTVTVHYTGRLEDGTPFVRSEGRDLLTFTLGDGEVPQAFEAAVVGMKPGERVVALVPPDGGPGPQPPLVTTVDRRHVPTSHAPAVGQPLRVRRPNGWEGTMRVVAVTESTVTLNARDELAGKNVAYEIKLLQIESTTDQPR